MDGVLHRLSLSDAGILSETGKVKFAKTSTSTPTISGGKLFVGGQSETYIQVSKWVKAYYGVLAVIDAESLLVSEVSTIDGLCLCWRYERAGDERRGRKVLPLCPFKTARPTRVLYGELQSRRRVLLPSG